MSSSGILFTTSVPLSVGMTVELSITWPIALNGSCPLNLVVLGRVVRSDSEMAAMRFDRYEFQTRGSKMH